MTFKKRIENISKIKFDDKCFFSLVYHSSEVVCFPALWNLTQFAGPPDGSNSTTFEDTEATFWGAATLSTTTLDK